MLQIDNGTPFLADVFLTNDTRGIESVVVIAKATFDMAQSVKLAEVQMPLVEADEYWGEAGTSSIRYVSDYGMPKPGVDIILNGHALAPEGRPVRCVDVSLALPDGVKSLRVWGDRVWQEGGQISQAEPFTEMPLVYEKAFGGSWVKNGEVVQSFSENPVGLGLLREGRSEVGMPLPNIEYPSQALTSPKQIIPAAGFGYLSPNWPQRSQYAGTYDEHWQQQRAPYLPKDFDPQFFHAVEKDQILPGWRGLETVTLKNMSKSGDIEFTIPEIFLKAQLDVAGKLFNVNLSVDTVLLEPDLMRYSLTWKAMSAMDKNITKLNRIKLKQIRERR